MSVYLNAPRIYLLMKITKYILYKKLNVENNVNKSYFVIQFTNKTKNKIIKNFRKDMLKKQ